MNDFLAVAEKLKVRGLWEEGSGRRGLLEEGKAKSRPAPADSPPPKRVKLVKVEACKKYFAYSKGKLKARFKKKQF